MKCYYLNDVFNYIVNKLSNNLFKNSEELAKSLNVTSSYIDKLVKNIEEVPQEILLKALQICQENQINLDAKEIDWSTYSFKNM